jgi:hypothetical protein
LLANDTLAVSGAGLKKHVVNMLNHSPRVLLLTAHRFLMTTRLALMLYEAGMNVDALCPAGHSLERVKFISHLRRFRVLNAVRSIRDAIEELNPDFIIPVDDFVAPQLHELYRLTNLDGAANLRALIARSLGDTRHYPVLYERDRIAALATAAGVRSPPTINLRNKQELLSQLTLIGFPAVLKTDASYGGMGVAIVRDQADAERAFHRLTAYPGFPRTVKRLIIDADATLLLPRLRRHRARVSIQRYIDGRLANAAVASWKGETLAQVSVEVLASNGATGPATVVRVIANSEIARAVECMVDRLKLSGLSGFDFILDGQDGSAHLIDFNPRATQTCHLVSADGKQPVLCLVAKLKGLPLADSGQNPRLDPIVLFPHGFSLSPKSPYSQYADSDLPSRWPEFGTIAREFHRKRNRFPAQAIKLFRKLTT